jgi:predicted lipoprotein with Yx(FWY)xxD motif
MRRIYIGLLTCLLALAVTVGIAAAANVHGSAARGKTLKIETRKIAGLGTVLVSSSGRTLYMFAPDKQKKVTCVSSACVQAWPPVFLPAGATPKAAGMVKQSLLGSVKDAKAGGKRVVTYKGWPLYLFAGDRKPGQTTGQDLDVTGGYWWVMSYTGAIIKHKPTTTTTTTPGTTTLPTTGTSTVPCQDGDNDGDENAGGPDDGDGCL